MSDPKRPGTVPIPETQPFAKTFQALASGRAPRQLERAAAAGATVQPVSPEELRAQMRLASSRSPLDVSAGAPSKVDLTQRDHDGSRMKVRVIDLRYYDGNPRESINENFHDIKEGLRAVGFAGSMVVTRRPNEDAFMLAFGSNTTLRAMKELWEETGDARFEWIECVVRVYRGEAWLLGNHLIENNNRGALTFWDNARGVMRMKQLLEAEHSVGLSLRDLEAELRKRGLPVSKTTVSLYAFATDRLAGLGPATPSLTLRAVEEIRERAGAVRRLSSLFAVAEDRFWAEFVQPALREVGTEWEPGSKLDVGAVCARIESALAALVGESLATIREMLALLARDPALTLADLRRPRPATPRPSRDAGGRDTASSAASMPNADTRVGDDDTDSTLMRAIGYDDLALPKPSPSMVALFGADPASIAAGFDPEGAAPPVQPAAVLAALTAALRLARACDVGDSFRLADALPLGYHMELPEAQAGGPSLQAQAGNQRHSRAWHAWWLLGEIAGQFDEAVTNRIADGSRYVAAWRDEQRYVEAQSLVGVHPESSFVLEWMLDADDDTGVLVLDLIRLARLAHREHPNRWPVGATEPIYRD